MSSGERRAEMYWHNPKTLASERRLAPSTDEEAIELLAGDPDSATFVTEYGELRSSGLEIETALILVGHEFWLRRVGDIHLAAFRPRALGYEPLLGTGPSSRR
jgi:hypothetical protein